MSYDEVIKKYKNNKDDYRLLMMKLSINNSFEELLTNHLKEIPETDTVLNLFNEMKGEWEIKCGRGNRVFDEKKYHKPYSRDCAVLFTIRVLSNNFTTEDKRHFYNVYKFIQTHSDVFGDKIRYHIRNTLEKKLTQKQQQRERNFKLNIINDFSESDTESSESEEERYERCESCENPSYACDCY